MGHSWADKSMIFVNIPRTISLSTFIYVFKTFRKYKILKISIAKFLKDENIIHRPSLPIRNSKNFELINLYLVFFGGEA